MGFYWYNQKNQLNTEVWCGSFKDKHKKKNWYHKDIKEWDNQD